jgi:NodT family efflux transporter outer membrane factor (OMF) lipoprotein
MNTMRTLIPPLSAALLTACAVGPNFKPPEPPAAERYTSEPLPDVQLDTAAAPAQWWTAFQSPQLDDTIRVALEGSPSLIAAEARLAQANEVVAASRGARAPEVSLGASLGRQKYGSAFLGPMSFPPFTFFSIGANVSYALDFSGSLRRDIERQGALAEAQAQEVEAARLTLTGNAVLQALTIASVRAQIKAVEGILAEDQRNVDLVRTALEAGSVARVDLLSAQSQLAQDETLLPPLRQQLSVARHALAVLVGRPPGAWAAPDFDLESFQPNAGVALIVPSELARRRPDIRAQEARLHAATAEVGLATANLYPQIKLTGSLSQQSLTAGELFDSSNVAWGLVGNLTAPLFDGGRLRAERRATLEALKASAADYQQTVLTAFEQVANVLTALEHDAQQSTAQQHAMDIAEQNLSLTRESFREGNVGVLQVLDAERLVQQARIGYVRAQGERLKDLAELSVSLGGSARL